MQHGIFQDAGIWILNEHEQGGKAQAHLLAEAGFDVWLGNSRGTRFSKGHAQIDLNE